MTERNVPIIELLIYLWVVLYLVNHFLCWENPCGVVANILESDIIISEFKLQLHYYIHFHTDTTWKGIEPLYSPSYGLNNIITALLQGWLWH